MIDYQIYKIIHMLGLALLMLGLGGVVFAFAVSATVPPKLKMAGFAAHGIGLFLMLLGGFGMLARLGLIGGLPGWIIVKLAIWLAFGAFAALAKRKVLEPGTFLTIFAVLVAGAAYMAIYKPF